MPLSIKKEGIGRQQDMCLCKMALDTKFVKEIGFQLDPAIWDEWGAVLYGFIESYVRQYDSSPMPVLKRMVKEKALTMRDEEQAMGVVRYAGEIQNYYEEHKELFTNDKYVRDLILRWIKLRNLTVLRDKLEAAVDAANPEAGEEALHRYSSVKQVEFTAVDMFTDIDKIARAYEEERGELFTLGGDLGKMTGPLSRGDFILVLGESGTGKSFVCLQIGYDAAIHAGLSVLYINCENTESQMIRRIYSNMTGRPRETKEVNLPKFVADTRTYNTDNSEGVVDKWRIQERRKKLEAPNLERDAMQNFLNNRVMESNGGQFKLQTFAPKELTVSALEHLLDNLRDYQKFIPDVLIVDYGDLLRPENMREDKRTQIDNIFLGLRAIALDRDICVISPTQSNRAGYGKDVKKANMAENIGNVNHASMILGLNHTDSEKERGIMRVKILKNRDGVERAEGVLCLGCMDIGRPIMYSKFLSSVNYNPGGDSKKEEDDD